MEDPSPSPAWEGPAPVDAKRENRRALTWIAGMCAGVLVLGAATGFLLLRPDGQRAAVAEVKPRPSREPTPVELATLSLDEQAAALLAGDEKGWLAAVEPDLRSRYRALYRNLRALDVSHLEYHPYPRAGGKKDTTVELTAHLSYCFSVDTCPEWRRDEYFGPPRVVQQLTLKLTAGRYIVTEIDNSDGTDLQPTPWEGAELAFARGDRVTVAGPKSQAKKLKRVLTVAEKAARVSDRFAKYLNNPQQRYRIYVADKKAWKSWYGGFAGDWAVGYAIPLNDTGTDVVLRLSELGSDEQLRTTVKHELGHAVTLGGAAIRDFDSDQWLSEGIAEYIGWSPSRARDSWNVYSVRDAFRGSKPPRTIVSQPINDKSGDRTVNAFYALGHFAADCLATRYGEAELFEFVRLTLREDKTHDQASKAAFGVSFAAADKACVKWIRSQVD